MLAGSDLDAFKATELANGLLRSSGEPEVELGDFGAVERAGVGDLHGDVSHNIPEVAVTSDSFLTSGVLGKGGRLLDVQVGVGEGSVGETVTEGVSRGDVVGVEVTVVEIDTYGGYMSKYYLQGYQWKRYMSKLFYLR